MIRTTSLRCALNDLRAEHARAEAFGYAKDSGEHLPSELSLADETSLTRARVKAVFDRFDYVRMDAKGRVMSHNYV